MAFDLAGGDFARSAGAEQPVGPYLRAVRRHWVLVVLVALLAAGAAVYTVSALDEIGDSLHERLGRMFRRPHWTQE